MQEQDARSQAHGIIAAAQADADKCIAEARHEALVAAASVPSAVDALAPARLARLPSFLRDRITGRRTSSGASPHSPAGQATGRAFYIPCNCWASMCVKLGLLQCHAGDAWALACLACLAYPVPVLARHGMLRMGFPG